ncbi:MAG: response regulator [Clostridia bacterium]|nr:response regulator [Clostridia bacterium]
MEEFDFTNKRIAIIDDDKGITESYKKILERRKFWVIVFNNPIEALEWFNVGKNDVDVILLDYYMPEKTGKQFAEEYEGNAVIILQTGYSGELPPDEMMDVLNIQNYFDKTRDVEELILSVKSAIKTAALYKKVNMLDYQKEFISNLLVNVTDETKDQVMALAGQKVILEDESDILKNDNIKQVANKIGISLEKINNTFKALNFATNGTTETLKEIFDTVNILTFAKSSATFKIESNQNIIVNCKANFLVYILSEIIMYLYENNKREQFEVVGKKIEDKTEILINVSFNYSNDIINKIYNIASNEDKIKILINDKSIIQIII